LANIVQKKGESLQKFI
jgi:hypothetical protein